MAMTAARVLTWDPTHPQRRMILVSSSVYKNLNSLILINMKHIKIYIVLTMAFVIISNTGCKKLLEEKPKAIASLGQLDPVLLDQTVIGVYEPMTRSRGRLWESTVGLGFELMS